MEFSQKKNNKILSNAPLNGSWLIQNKHLMDGMNNSSVEEEGDVDQTEINKVMAEDCVNTNGLGFVEV